MPMSGPGLISLAAGSLFVYAGIKRYSILGAAQNLIKGQPANTGQTSSLLSAPVSQAGSNPYGGGNFPLPPSTGTAASNQAIARLLAAPYGWSAGQQWSDLVQLWTRESGWSNTARNPTSGAYGIAQALGHGPTNQYPAGPANPPTSSASAQISWGLKYIKDTYGSPSAAWAHETSIGWY